MRVEFVLNGARADAEVEPGERLLDVLRRVFTLTGTKEGCGEGECGACTVLLEGEPVLSCLVPVFQAHGRTVRTVEYIGNDPAAREFLERFVDAGAAQCGACTPGIIVTAWAASQDGRPLTRDEVNRALAGNLCRCTGYEAIVRSLAGEDAP